MTLTCAIVDDEPLALTLLESYVRKTPFLELKGKYSSAVQAMNELPDNEVNLLFLDIQMPELSGIDFSKMVNPNTRIIFTTAFNQYALDGYRVNALDYLLKPINYAEFLEASNKALHWFTLTEKANTELSSPSSSTGEEIDSIFVKSEYKLIQIKLDEILYIEGFKDYIKIYTENQPKPVLTLLSMKSIEDMLPGGKFLRIHRSFIVQKSKIRTIERNRIVFGKVYIPVGDSYKKEFQEFLNARSL